eukprot:866-Heterococcus_DN1.PRE.2
MLLLPLRSLVIAHVIRYETEGRARKTIKARQLWEAILVAQCETGTPYMLFKDACNSKSNQQNLGTIKCSNLCTEIVEYTSPDEVAVCNLASINLSAMVNSAPVNNTPGTIAAAATFDFQRLYHISKVVTRNLNKVVDVNFYPVIEAKNSNMRHRPIGLGVQGLADTFIKMRHPFESPEAAQLNKDIFETIYFGAVEASMELAEQLGPYETYEGSPASQGLLQFDMWGVTPSNRWDWASLKAKIAIHGLRNSLLVAPMPTASTAQILQARLQQASMRTYYGRWQLVLSANYCLIYCVLAVSTHTLQGNNESIEPFTSNMYNRRVLAGEFAVINKYLLKDLTDMGLWTAEVRNQIMANGGSIQAVTQIPQHLRDLYKTVWEIKQKAILDMAADRGAYICQSQSLNVHLAEPTHGKLTSMHFYSWKKGLKTGMYYLRTRPKADAIQFTVDQASLAKAVREQAAKGKQDEPAVISEEDDGECLSCGA